MTYQLLHGDCLDVMATLDAASVDALILDPPAGISFMGREFDSARGGRDKWIAWLAERLSAARRVLKPGHYSLVWALPRTSHWTGMACEDAGFTVIDRVSHIFGSGFPKGKNKLKPAVEDWWLIRAPGPAAALHIDACRVGTNGEDTGRVWKDTPSAGKQYDHIRQAVHHVGSVSGGNPAGRWPPHLVLSHTPLCRATGVKRVRGSNKSFSTDYPAPNGYEGGWSKRLPRQDYADADGRETVASFDCVEGCPVRELGEMSGERPAGSLVKGTEPSDPGSSYLGGWRRTQSEPHGDTGTASRFYPNLAPPEWECQPGCPIAALDEQSGESVSRRSLRGAEPTGNFAGMSQGGAGKWESDIERGHDDAGTAARFFPNLDPPFFYAAKASRRERGAGCDNLYWLADDTRGSGYRPITRAEYEAAQAAGERVARGNMHPTVKNIKLLSWLINLLTVPGDVILDPFAGSGSIGVAAIAGGRSFVGIEMDEDYISIAEARLAEAAAQPRQLEIAV